VQDFDLTPNAFVPSHAFRFPRRSALSVGSLEETSTWYAGLLRTFDSPVAKPVLSNVALNGAEFGQFLADWFGIRTANAAAEYPTGSAPCRDRDWQRAWQDEGPGYGENSFERGGWLCIRSCPVCPKRRGEVVSRIPCLITRFRGHPERSFYTDIRRATTSCLVSPGPISFDVGWVERSGAPPLIPWQNGGAALRSTHPTAYVLLSRPRQFQVCWLTVALPPGYH